MLAVIFRSVVIPLKAILLNTASVAATFGLIGLAAVASTISSAALIMGVVFGYFAFSRVLLMQFLGFGLAVAVLLDAT